MRKKNRSAGDALFLHVRAAEDIAERLLAIPRRFDRALLIDPHGVMAAAINRSAELANRIGATQTIDLAAHDLAFDPTEILKGSGAYDLIVSPLVLHWANDLPGAFALLVEALQPDGLLIASLLGGDTLQELRACLLAAESNITGGAALRVGPFVQLRDLAGLLQRVGFALPAADRDIVTVRYQDPFALIRDLRAMGENAAYVAGRRRPLLRNVAAMAFASYAQDYADADCRMRASFDILTATGWRPHPSQQKPLQPGSAKARLADALGTDERSLQREY